MQLSDRKMEKPGKIKSYEIIVPLPEVIAASTGKSSGSKRVQEQYENMLKKLGSEFDILRKIRWKKSGKRRAILSLRVSGD